MIDEAIILCGGKGTRLAGVLPDGMPKCMAMVGGVPFLDRLIWQLEQADVTRIVLATGYGADGLNGYANPGDASIPTLIRSHENQPLGTGGAVRKALDHVRGERFFVLNGDSYIDYPLHQFATWFDIVHPDGAALLVQSPDYRSKTLGLMEEAGEWINGGVYLFERSLVESIQPWPSCEPVPLSLETDCFPVWRRNGAKLMGYHTWSRFIDIGTPESLARAEDFFKELQPCKS